MRKELMLSLQTGTWYKMFGGDENPDGAFKALSEAGFEAVDFGALESSLPTKKIRVGELSNFYDADLETLLDYYRPAKEAADKYGIEFAQAHAPFPMHVPGHPQVVEYLVMVVQKMLYICKMLDCPYLIVHPSCFPSKKQEWEENMAMYRQLIPAAKESGVKICLENMHLIRNAHKVGGACSNMEEACRYIDALNEEAGEAVFGFCYDVGHANLTSNDVLEDLRTLDQRLFALHIHDNDAMKDLHLVPFASRITKKEWTTDWEGFFQGLREIGYKGAVNFETGGSLIGLPEELVKPMMTFAAASCAYFRKRLTE